MSFFQDFKKFLSRGNVIDMTVGIILGASFTKIVDALVNHVLMPPLRFLSGGIDFSRLKITLQESSESASAITMDLDILMSALLNFFIAGFAIFVSFKILNRLHAKITIFTKKNCPECKMEIPINALRCGYCATAFSKNELL